MSGDVVSIPSLGEVEWWLVTLGVAFGSLVLLGLAIVVTYAALRITGGVLSAIGWTLGRIWELVKGTVSDLAAGLGALVAAVVALPIAAAYAFGRPERARAALAGGRRELGVAGEAFLTAFVRRPLRVLGLGRALDGLEHRLPQALRAGATPDAPIDPASFPGYEVVGTLAAGGSGARLFVAVPTEPRRGPAKVVIKSFALADGSELPQIVRESRALEPARALGLVVDHGLDERRFWYAMPFHEGLPLSAAIGRLHERDERGLGRDGVRTAVGWSCDLASTLVRFHAAGLWHKDLKPDNVIVAGGRATLVDLGLVTPLRSAMTLTTHGTEYFRDPEMVRQALRGVKVHEVDGVRFDLYGLGAVLYFMLEGTFPAHGGLSGFAKESPEALRWIVRRAMADYRRRYASADEMLADLVAVRAVADPWAFRPAELPSVAALDREADAAPTPSPEPPPPPRPPATPVRTRPRLRVTNWWTGRYGPG